jgi:hypothetical protein
VNVDDMDPAVEAAVLRDIRAVPAVKDVWAIGV